MVNNLVLKSLTMTLIEHNAGALCGWFLFFFDILGSLLTFSVLY
jgi:hypothetical protein